MRICGVKSQILPLFGQEYINLPVLGQYIGIGGIRLAKEKNIHAKLIAYLPNKLNHI